MLFTMTEWSPEQIPDQRGRTVLVTGANSGLGFRSAEALARAGARVLMACRNLDKGAVALDAVKSVARDAAPELIRLDLSDLASVEAAARETAALAERLDVLMNNAGIMAVPLARTAQGWEMQFAINHLGHFALTAHLLPQLLAAPAPRVVTTSSHMHRVGCIRFDDLQWERRRYRKWAAYSQAKLANLLFAFELARRAAASGSSLVSVAAHPGYARTHLQEVGPELSGSKLMARVMDLGTRLLAQSDTAGAMPQLYAATMPEVRNGDYSGPSGSFERAGPPKRVPASRTARDEAVARRLWEVSAELTGTSPTFP